MRPRTVLEHKVVKYSKRLPEINDRQIAWVKKTIFKYYMYKTNSVAICFECGHEWEDKVDRKTLLASLTTYICPWCGKELVLNETRGWKRTDIDHFHIFVTYKGFQVVRGYHVRRTCYKGKKACYDINEVFQHWFSADGKHTILARFRNSYGYYSYVPWILHKDMEIKHNNACYYIGDELICPYSRISPIIRRNGFKGNFHGHDPAGFFRLILKYPIAETLLKIGEINLFKIFPQWHDRIETLWPQIKICIRNNYQVPDFHTWVDHIRLLSEFGKDIMSPKYICPANLKKEHNKYIEKVRKRNEKKRKAELYAEMAKDNVHYQKRLKKYMNIEFSNGDIKVATIKTVQDLYQESNWLKHCAFSNEYHKDNRALLLSARKGDTVLETVHVEIPQMEIVQSRGVLNGISEYHNDIVALVRKNIKKYNGKKKRTKVT